MLWLLLLAVCILGAGYYRWTMRRIYHLSKHIKCDIPCLPVIGPAQHFIGDHADKMQGLQLLARETIKQGGITGIWFAHKYYVSVADVEILEVVMKTCLEKDYLVSFIRMITNNGSIFAPVPIWRPRRKLVAPTFSPKNLNSFVDVFSRQSSIMVSQLKRAPEGSFPVWNYMTSYAMDSVCDGNDNFKSFLELLIEGKKGLTEVELREEVLVMVLAGTDTSAVGTSFTAVMLSRHQEVQDKVYQELIEVLGDTDRPIVAEDLPRLKYLEAVIKETLRLHPPVPNVLRKVEKDVTLPSGLTLVNGCGVAISIWAIHRNPKYWGLDAEEFRPERFVGNYNKRAFMAFSMGPRNCVGYQYAMMSMKTAVASIVRQFRVLPAAEDIVHDGLNTKFRPIREAFEIMMKDVNKFLIRLESRN